MPDDPNLFGGEWQFERGGRRGTRVGAAAGGRSLGATVFELDPGVQATPYHLHHANEELLVVLSGTPELRTPAGTRTLEPGAVVAFVRGSEGAHRVRNASDSPCRYLIVSEMNFPEIVDYPDTGTVLSMTAPAEGKAFPAGADRDYVDLVEKAIEADSG